jgi:elongation factor G
MAREDGRSGAEATEELMNKYLEAASCPWPRNQAGLRARTINNEIVPMLCGSAFKNKGVQAMLDAVIDYLPAPTDIPPVKGIENESRRAQGRRRRAVRRLAFKIMTDPFVGSADLLPRLFRRVNSGDTIYNPVKGARSASAASCRCMPTSAKRSRKCARATSLPPSGSRKRRRATRCAIRTTSSRSSGWSSRAGDHSGGGAEDQGGPGEDGHRAGPSGAGRSFVPRAHGRGVGQTIISGMGELHLEIIVDRMKREFNVEANVGQAAGGYTARRSKASTRSKASSSSSRAAAASTATSGSSWSRTRPARASSSSMRSRAARCRASTFPPSEGSARGAAGGVLAGYPVVDVKVTLFDGSYHEVDSNENAFKMAGIDGVQGRHAQGDPVLLEPMMAVEVETPEDFMGNVMGDLSSRRGMIQGMDDMVGGGKVIKAEVPLAEMFGYSTTLRSLTQGRATYTMEFKHYSEAPEERCRSDHQQEVSI